MVDPVALIGPGRQVVQAAHVPSKELDESLEPEAEVLVSLVGRGGESEESEFFAVVLSSETQEVGYPDISPGELGSELRQDFYSCQSKRRVVSRPSPDLNKQR